MLIRRLLLHIFQGIAIKSIINFLLGLLVGISIASQHLFSCKSLAPVGRNITDRPANNSTSKSEESKQIITNATEVKLSLNPENMVEFYEEYYKFYEQNHAWALKSFLGVHFLQNPNDAITIAEILYNQDIDLVIETGTYRGAAALFFASIMYQYRYDAKNNSMRPFKIITMDINPEARKYIDQFTLLAPYILFIPESSVSPAARATVNKTVFEMKPANVFISLDGDHYAEAVYNELLYYQQYVVNISNYMLVQDTRLSRKWHTLYCGQSKYDGPCNGPQEAVNWFMKNDGHGRFEIDRAKEYLFSTHQKGWLKRIFK
ncbi:unnamed protein product [Rotaria magnacalcarata]|uniref:Rhamnosyl O-methyltransferase n=2 Tax=Rotaria magnacalcarata TaxID=392030 RepID=A0A816LDP1_9BILA|nr:unnamed protein product [Rotaria magnacalcarata]CAF1928441.1 unnamed protein product [Rotaria magnacalcarata]CAF1994648.1 unnamed protein product [Rotaria magnacalcarata]CAF2136685.1 unnamed protein product [Rotaria magnacalcarata]CAF3951798.1 unnamed protein product [Rotaria magnacalcarata]